MNTCDQLNCQAVGQLHRFTRYSMCLWCMFPWLINVKWNVCRIRWTMYIVHRVSEHQLWSVMCIHPSPTPNFLLVYGSVAFTINDVSVTLSLSLSLREKEREKWGDSEREREREMGRLERAPTPTSLIRRKIGHRSHLPQCFTFPVTWRCIHAPQYSSYYLDHCLNSRLPLSWSFRTNSLSSSSYLEIFRKQKR